MTGLSKEFEFYKSHQNELVKKYKHKFIVIKDKAVIGAYNSYEEAVTESIKEHELGTFLIQKVEGGTSNFTQTFHSRVVINGR